VSGDSIYNPGLVERKGKIIAKRSEDMPRDGKKEKV